MEFYVLKAITFADSCNHSRVPGAHRLARHVYILSALAPLVAQVGRLGEHNLIDPNDLKLSCDGTLHTTLHFLCQKLIAAICGFLRHLSRTYYLPLDHIGLVDGVQAPRLNELVRVGTMEEDAPLLYTLGYPL